MKQPEIGRKITDLRKSRGFTQEALAFECGLNVRSIQRIENGEVEPRISTLRILSNILEFEFIDGQPDENRIWLVLLHLSSIFPIIIIALILSVWKRDSVPGMNAHAKDVLNFQISMCILLALASQLVLILIGIPILICIGIFTFFITVLNTIRVATGDPYHYPLVFPFLKKDV